MEQQQPASPFAAAGAAKAQPSCVSTAEVSPSAILLPSHWKAETGAALWEGTVLGKQLGAGVQARVFELVTTEGRPTGKVLKIGHGDIGHKLLNNPVIWIGMEREWEIGMQLRAALEQPDGSLPGFMRVCDCVVSTAGGGARFAGMILEKLNGWEIYKRIDQPEFASIAYIRECLFQVFSAMDRAQRKTGLHHADLGMRNVMENYPLLYEEPQADIQQQQRKAAAGVAPALKPPQVSANRYEASVGALPDETPRRVVTVTGDSVGGLGRAASSGGMEAGHPAPPMDGEPAAKLSMGAARHSEGFVGGCSHHVRPRVGFSCNRDGSRMPLGPHIEFKIIDYGVAVFDEDLAQAAGGFESRETLHRIRHLFASKRVTFKPEDSTKDGRVSMATSDSNMPGRKKEWHLVPTGVSNRFRVKHTPSGAAPVASAESLEAAPQRLQSTLGATVSRDLGEPNPEVLGGDKPPAPAMSPIERLYRRFWNRKGDVFHLLLSLAISLDDRVWPAQDKGEVELFVSLVHHVTGVEMKASFAHCGEVEGLSMLGRLLRVKGDHHGGATAARVKAWGARGKWHHFFRRLHIRAKAHIWPYNSGLLAGEALVAPFFGEGRVQHATLPVCVEAAFPDQCVRGGC